MARQVEVGLNAVILAVTDETPRVLTVRSGDVPALPFGPLDPEGDRTLELGLRRWVREQTGIGLGYVEQLYTFGDRDREAGPGDRRILSVGYLALVREEALETSSETEWMDIYASFPWEDLRDGGRPRSIEGALRVWLRGIEDRGDRQVKADRAAISFGLEGAPWDGYRVLERYELLYEAGLVEEAVRDRAAPDDGRAQAGRRLGRPMAKDHRRILATALGRIRGKLKYRPVVFELVPDTFTLYQLQRVVEALAGVRLHKQNFRRLVEKGGLVEGTGRRHRETGGRPAELFRFRREVLKERPTPGVGLPGARPRGDQLP
jgi:hypothetical protein